MLLKLYLTLYNLIQLSGWSYGLLQFVQHVITHGTYVGFWPKASTAIYAVQLMQVLEIIHAYLRWIPSNLTVTALQVFLRNYGLWLIFRNVPEVHDTIGVLMASVAWCSVEIIRSIFYTLKLYDINISWITWARYSFFLVNYPVGASGEILVALAALPYIQERKILSYTLPNPLNISFHFDYFIKATLVAAVYTVPKLYFHMLSQRKKALYGKSSSKGSTDLQKDKHKKRT